MSSLRPFHLDAFSGTLERREVLWSALWKLPSKGPQGRMGHYLLPSICGSFYHWPVRKQKPRYFISSSQLISDGKGFKIGMFLIQSQRVLLLGQKVHSLLCFQPIQYLSHHYFLHCNQLLQGIEVHLHPKHKWWGCGQSIQNTQDLVRLQGFKIRLFDYTGLTFISV